MTPSVTGRWSVGRLWNESLPIDDDVETCSVLVDELNFWSEFTDGDIVSELGNHIFVPEQHLLYI